ncbi:ABC transporter permease [Paenibacillus sp. Soil750]|uniref:ABC transporter permease n=1 Tax=Paenibacillus sp. Soil750 TaxID=1736398 RepID=UPI0006FD7AE4|nr:ABC transporter permease [Paenibacillus sp. Soil750]KRE75406.1 teichoic acid ABC transporter permease [Paenibacillus sp. Soil750]
MKKSRFTGLRDLLVTQKLIWILAKSDFKKKNIGSYLGITWAFIQPTINILLLWFVFQVGFKSTPVDNFPFILWLSTAMIAWNFFAESLQTSVYAITDSSYLVKKVVFRVSILPIVKIYSALFVHIFFLVFLFLMFLLYGYGPTIYLLQIPYYLGAMILLLLGLGWITSSITVFFKDVGQIISMVTQFGFWLTPIFYSLKIIPDKFLFFYKLNPMYYITEGYREAFIYHKWFWQHEYQTINFWMITGILLIVGRVLFKKLKPHFADVL